MELDPAAPGAPPAHHGHARRRSPTRRRGGPFAKLQRGSGIYVHSRACRDRAWRMMRARAVSTDARRGSAAVVDLPRGGQRMKSRFAEDVLELHRALWAAARRADEKGARYLEALEAGDASAAGRMQASYREQLLEIARSVRSIDDLIEHGGARAAGATAGDDGFHLGRATS